MYRLALCLVLVTYTFATPRSAAAAVTDFYDTVDSAEINKRDSGAGSNPTLLVRGILAGGTAPITRSYVFTGTTNLEGLETAMHCHRLAVLAMSRPGKYQFAIGPGPNPSTATGCRLTLVTP
jgi:hypothetical protein